MKNIFELRLNPIPFEQIKKGVKTIEMRLYDEKRKQFKVGDVLIFKNRDNEVLTIKTEIINIHLFKSFEELYSQINKTKLGYLENEPAHPSDMEQYYSQQEQSNYGVVGIEIRVIN